MVTVEILQVPLLTNNNRYLLVLQDYFTKWADNIPLPDQTTSCVTTALIKNFSVHMGHHNSYTQIKAKTLKAQSLHKYWKHLVFISLVPPRTTHKARRDEADCGTRDDWSPLGIKHLMVPAADGGVSEPRYTFHGEQR